MVVVAVVVKSVFSPGISGAHFQFFPEPRTLNPEPVNGYDFSSNPCYGLKIAAHENP
ncbi:MAG: hypothetical protein H8E19_04205 [Deltaproteobacteria bacterium]|uniref:Uncharacterized protein n=1 Tax=Candidatus Desulfacyla euxinica TaxID=2841693 RepID=A0A8J6T3T9_9DELT|nr:hypothetical protein [Candidatus Desulfacyla euxinica]